MVGHDKIMHRVIADGGRVGDQQIRVLPLECVGSLTC